MTEMTQIDRHIARILDKLKALEKMDPEHHLDEWPPKWEPPMSEEQVAAFEETHGIHLPEDYRRFLTTVAAGGNLPFYGLEVPEKGAEGWFKAGVPFRHSLGQPLLIDEMTQEEWESWSPEMEAGGLLALCTEGDGMDNALIVNSRDPAAYGTVWFCDLSNDFGIAPLRHPDTGEPLRFLDWLEYWVDQAARTGEVNAFSFAELIQLEDSED